MTDFTPRRQLKNLVIDKRALARLSVPFLIMALISIGLVSAMSWKVMQSLKSTELVGMENLPAMNALLEAQRSVTLMGTAGILGLTIVCAVLWLIYSHKIFGPTVPIRRHIHKLIEGDYSSRVHLRDGDELSEISEELNQLAEVLAEKTKP
jgi:HAMP domain-containing protein